MNKKLKATALALGVLTLATTGLTACKPEDDGSLTNTRVVYNGTHIYTATDTNEYLVKNGKTSYSLVVPETASATLRIAMSEFISLFQHATDITISVVSDADVTDASQGKYISLGRTKLLEDSGIVIDQSELDYDGHRIVTKGDDIYLCGGADEGTVFAVYTFMSVTFNYETYYYDCMEIERTSEKRLKNYDVTDVPDFKFRGHSSDVTMYESPDYDENMFAWRLKYYGKDGTRGYYWTPIHDKWWNFSEGDKGASTNIDHWFPEYIYNNEEEKYITIPNPKAGQVNEETGEVEPDMIEKYVYYPEWFSTMGTQQVCFSARGNEAAYKAMVNEAFEKVKATLAYYTPDKYPQYKVYSMTHMDNTNYCRCTECRRLSSYYGDSQAAIQVIFLNDLAALVDEWMEYGKETNAEWYREDFHLLFFAYNHNFTPPAKYNTKTKQYEPIDDKVKVSDRVIAWFCREADGQAVYNADNNEMCINALDGWGACANNIYYWDYGTNFKNYMFPLDRWQYATPEMYAYYCNKSDRYWFTQLQDNNPNTNTAWHNLKAYLEAKLAWNTSLNMDDLINGWFKAMFKEAAPAMLRVFQSVRTYQQYLISGNLDLGLTADGSVSIDRPEYWPFAMVQGWLNQMDNARTYIERYQVLDPEMYDKISKHIEAEALSNLYIILEFHGYSISASKRSEYIQRLTYDVEWLDLYNMNVGSKKLLTGWLAAL